MNGLNAAQPSLRRLDLHYIVMQMGYWAMFAAICAYLAALLGERGFSNSQIGLLIAIRCLAGIIFQPLLGGFADRHPEIPLKVIVSLSLALSLAASLAFLLWPMGMGGTAVILIILGGFEISVYPLMDAMAIQFTNAGMPIRYSLGRGIGSMAYAVTCVILGLQTQAMGVESTLITHAVLVAAVIALTITYPTFRAAPAAADAPPLRKSPTRCGICSFTLMLVAILLGLTACLPMSNFLVNVVESRGGNSADLGVALFIMGGFELPTAFFFQRMLRRLGSGKLILISMVFTVLKAVALLLSFQSGHRVPGPAPPDAGVRPVHPGVGVLCQRVGARGRPGAGSDGDDGGLQRHGRHAGQLHQRLGAGRRRVPAHGRSQLDAAVLHCAGLRRHRAGRSRTGVEQNDK